MEKRFILIGLVYCWILQTNAQTYQNTIVSDNSSWNTLFRGVCPECPVNTQYIYFDTDSVLGEITYKKVFSCNDKLHENIRYEGLIREQDRKTYFIPASCETEFLLYDFSLEEGMSFKYIDIRCPDGYEPVQLTHYVKKIDFVEINGIQKKKIQFTFNPNDNSVSGGISNSEFPRSA